MHNRSKPSQPADASIDVVTLRATPDGTARYASRFSAGFVTGFYRKSAFGLAASALGIGTYLGDSSKADDAAYESSVREAIALGVNIVDTAINYRCQRSELNIGAALQRVFAESLARRDEIVVCSKGGYIPLNRVAPETREAYQDYIRREFIEPEILLPEQVVAGGHCIAPRFLRYCLAKSRQNLGLRTIDLYYIHNPEQQLAGIDGVELDRRLTAAFSALEEAADRGEIGGYGVATWESLRSDPGAPGHLEVEQLVEIARRVAGGAHHFRALQLPINLAMTEGAGRATQRVGGRELSVVDAAQELGVDVVASATLLQSRLASGLPRTVAEAFPNFDSDAARAIAFVRGLSPVWSGLVGMRTVEHVHQNVGSAHR